MAASDPRTEYLNRLAAWDAVIAEGERRHLLVSNLRLAAAGGAVLLAWLGLGRGLVAPSWAFAPALLFLALLVVHAFVLNAQDRARRARRYFERGLSRMDGTWAGSGPDGARFLDDHPYARDLDLFGAGSLFQLLDTARTETGEATLADWLRSSASVEDITSRQAAVAELRGRLGFREALAIHAAEARVSRAGALASWASMPSAGLGTGQAWLFAACASITAVLVLAAVLSRMPASLAVAWVAVQAGIAQIWRRKVWYVLRAVDAAADDLGLLCGLLERVEGETFESPRLGALHAALVVSGVPASRRLARLRRLVAARDALRNEFIRPFALLLLVRSQSAVAIDRWHARHRDDLVRWMAAVGELEAIASLATYAFEHPDDPFPAMVSAGPVLVAEGLAHPLIQASRAVRNDVRLGADAPHVLVVSGSNMSGKSTLLRAVGTNVVLAMAGAPVRAHALTLSPLAIGATIRVEDSLQEGQSRFYAEITRIRDIVDRARGALPVLFLLDEILGGTNSYDRRIGAEAIVRGLVETGAIGLMTTHDLALTELSEQLGQRARNVHFEDRLENGTLVFDYRMRDGVVRRSNALELMRAVGLDV